MASARTPGGPEASPPPLVLALGGQRSGKSAWAERRALATGALPVYIATARAGDAEMAARIEAHRERRGGAWQVVEEPSALAEALERWSRPGHVVLVDCLTLWLSNLLVGEADLAGAVGPLLSSLDRRQGPIVLVSNEVGSGVIPMHPLGRRFVDEAGRLHQAIARRADEVVLVVAGRALVLPPAD